MNTEEYKKNILKIVEELVYNYSVQEFEELKRSLNGIIDNHEIIKQALSVAEKIRKE